MDNSMTYGGLDANPTGGVVFPYQSGFFISPRLTAFNGNVQDLSTTVIVPIKIENATNIDAVRILAGATPYSGWKFGLYQIDTSSNPATLGTAVVEATSLNGTSNINTTHTFTSTPVSRGSYWFALSPQGGSGSIASISSIAISATQPKNHTISSQQVGSIAGVIGSSGAAAYMSFTTAGTIAASTALSADATAGPVASIRIT